MSRALQGMQGIKSWNRGDWLWYLILLFTLTVPLSQFLSSRILGLVFLVSLIQCRPALALARAWDMLIYLVVICLGLLYSDDLPFGIRVLETSLSFIFISLIFSAVNQLEESRLHRLLTVFLVSTCVGCAACLGFALVNYLKSGSASAFLYYELTGLLDFQPTYFAYFLVFSITIGLSQLYSQKALLPPVIVGILVLFLFLALVLTGGRTSFISMLLVFSFFMLKFFLEKGNRIQRATFGLVIFMMACLFGTTAIVGDSTSFSDSWERYDLWKSAMEANEDPIFGVGTGDYKNILNNFFANHGMPQYASESLNPHNQFIQTYLSNGLLGVLSLFLLMGRPLYLAFRRDNTLTILVVFPFLLYGMTEVFLGRYQGVVFFAWVHQVFVTYLLTNSKPNYTLKSV